MREILFRGKQKDNGEWVEGYYVNVIKPYCKLSSFNKAFGTYIIASNNEMVEVIPETVGQYTGLTDKNGKKVYEGDIIKYENRMECGIGIIELLEFLQVQVRWTRQNTPYPTEFSGISVICYPNEVEVIGNIHDNPELLEVGE